ncbi:hypothetical protein JG687_00019496 [Phytophthora cactorum]|uniref:Uncharacterized protein n=1 Tax=Phytophthora cactorum TaxID=29920 RepID=A0A8T1TKI2_9STRA|nr:hypothetical protein PC120_g12002 [Phytophthora cactorum]KAG3075220.1 hypothetical protein PC121_g8093 [Phytophthora cactorum]KAG4049862.1 hypothetical protein PC123_g14870 [Phytophthora cactorum]KAG6941684.1 hypothetical protein JG687_00019496 [Phytophthora cactorum]
MSQDNKDTIVSASTASEDLTPSAPSSLSATRHRYSRAHITRQGKELLRSKLRQIERMEEKLQILTNHFEKLIEARDELAMMLAEDRGGVARLVVAVGAASLDVGYVMSYNVSLEECCRILIEKY